jgi:hypothetical protein
MECVNQTEQERERMQHAEDMKLIEREAEHQREAQRTFPPLSPSAPAAKPEPERIEYLNPFVTLL